MLKQPSSDDTEEPEETSLALIISRRWLWICVAGSLSLSEVILGGGTPSRERSMIAIRCELPTCGAARPIPFDETIVSYMSSRNLWSFASNVPTSVVTTRNIGSGIIFRSKIAMSLVDQTSETLSRPTLRKAGKTGVVRKMS